MPSQWPDMLRCRLWTTSRQYFCKVYIISHTLLYKFVDAFLLPCRSSPQLIIYHRFDLLLSVLGFTGEVGGDFYFVLQGSVAIKINNEVIKVCGSQVCFWSFRLRSRIIAP